MGDDSKAMGAWSIKGLGAMGPDPGMEEKMKLFGQFVGDWDIVRSWQKLSDGTEVRTKGEVHFGWILGGSAVQDVWMGCEEGSEKVTLFGTTIRFYDPEIDAWRSTWISPFKGLVKKFIARKVGDEIVLESKTVDGHPEKWIFSDITRDTFRWRSEETRDGGRTWLLTEEMHIRRAEPSSAKDS
jgi:hypothetical protein